jgi:hypothetical protein
MGTLCNAVHTLCAVSVWLMLQKRQSAWAAAVLAVVVAGLVHVLGCAHGPQDDGVGRADSFLSAASTQTEHISVAPSRGAEPAECTGADAPGWVPGAAVAAPATGTSVEAVEDATAGQLRPPCMAPRAGPQRVQARSVLGVWRT